MKPRESEQAEVDLERDIPVSALQDAAVAQAAAEETRRRIAHIVVAQAQKAVGRLKELLESAAAPVDTAEPVVPVQIVEQRVEVPRPKPEKASTPKIVPPAIVTSSKAETTPAPKPKTEPVPAGRSGVTHGASLLDLPTPHYPLASRRRGEEGLITLRVDVHADGSVGEVEIVSGARFKRLRQAAIEAIRRARFAPAKRDGKAIVSVVIVPIRFTLR